MLMHLDPTSFVADPELFHALEERSTSLACGEDLILFEQGELPMGLYILHNGEATLSIESVEGTPILCVNPPAGSLLGLPSLLGNQGYSMTAVAHAGAQVSFVSISEFTTLIEANPQLSLKILQVLANEVRSARRALY
jgi:CRP/FNR family transcriptional regulator, polysaccharide utilization system transcription regulator